MSGKLVHVANPLIDKIPEMCSLPPVRYVLDSKSVRFHLIKNSNGMQWDIAMFDEKTSLKYVNDG